MDGDGERQYLTIADGRVQVTPHHAEAHNWQLSNPTGKVPAQDSTSSSKELQGVGKEVSLLEVDLRTQEDAFHHINSIYSSDPIQGVGAPANTYGTTGEPVAVARRKSVLNGHGLDAGPIEILVT